MLKFSIDAVKEVFSRDGYIVLDNIYKGAHSKLRCLCPAGHEIYISFQKFKQGRRCKYCSGVEVYFDDIVSSFNKEGYEVLSKKEDYINSKSKLDYLCPQGHRGSMSWVKWKTGTRCKECYFNSIKVSTDKIIGSLHKEGYTVLSDLPENPGSKLKFRVRCPAGHEHFTSWNAWNSGYRCKTCMNVARHDKLKSSLCKVKHDIEKCGYKLLSGVYENAFAKLSVMCDKGHVYEVRWNDWQQGCRCPKCAFVISNGQQDLSGYLKQVGLNVIENDRSILGPKELDIVLPDKKIAIEYCGLYWHSEKMGKDKNYHINKYEKCKDAGYRLITIFEDEWLYKNEIVKSRILSILGLSKSDKIYARECAVKEISCSLKNEFLENNHLQGKDISSVNLGLFFNKKLVSVMTFSKSNISKGFYKKDGVWELNRFCSDRSSRVVGGASKLLSYFKKNYSWSIIFSYADRRWSEGSLYECLGFEFKYGTKPNYWYVSRGGSLRIHRYNLRKTNKDPIDMTEAILREGEGYYRVWDCGNLRYELFNR